MKTDIEPILKKFSGAGRDQLIPLLQEVQDHCGYISKEAVAKIGQRLGLPSSKVYGVATFYNQFRFQPIGKYHFMVCRGTACHVKGSAKVLDTLMKSLEIKPGETTRDGLFSIEVVACMGACALAPAMSVNGEVHPKVSPKKILKLLEECRQKASAENPAAQENCGGRPSSEELAR